MLATTITVLAVFWPDRAVPRDRTFAAVVAAYFGSYLLGGLAVGVAPTEGLWMSAVNLMVALAFGWTYRRWNSVDDWAPGSARDIVLLGSLSAGSASLVVALGGIPAGGLFDIPHPGELFWSTHVASGTLSCLPIGLVLLLSTRRSATRAVLRPQHLPIMMLGLVALILPYLTPAYPLSWMVFIPALWLGLTFPPRVVALLLTVPPTVALLVTTAAYWRTPQDLGIPPYLMMQLAQFVAGTVALTSSYQREDSALYSQEFTARRIRTAADNAVLGAVFRSMHDGVLVLDSDGELIMSNQAAQRLLGEHVVTTPTSRTTWSQVSHTLRLPDGSAPADPNALGRLLTDSGPSDPVHVGVATDSSSGWRALSMSARPFLLSDRAHRLVMVQDITADQERRHQLKSFARAVAAELYVPLEALGGSIGATQDILWDKDLPRGRAALHSTIQQAARIRCLIDDHVAFTLAREGVIRPAAVELAPLLEQIAWTTGQDAVALDVATPHAVFADPSLTRKLAANLIQHAVERAQDGQRAMVRVISEPGQEPGWVSVTVAERTMGTRRTHPPAPLAVAHVLEHGISARRAAERASASPPAIEGQPRLALCQAIVTRHGGHLTAVTDAVGATTFTFTLPSA